MEIDQKVKNCFSRLAFCGVFYAGAEQNQSLRI